MSQHLKTLPTEEIKVAVLCDVIISARRLTELLRREITTPVVCYDGGVEKFNYDAPEYREDRGEDGGLDELTQWLRADYGILVTHEPQYRGCEADTVIMVTEVWGGGFGVYTRRNGLTRGVAHSALVTSDLYINVREMEEHGWDVEMEEGSSEMSEDSASDTNYSNVLRLKQNLINLKCTNCQKLRQVCIHTKI